MRDPHGRGAHYLAISDLLGRSLPHKERACQKPDQNKRNKRYLHGSVVENERERVASNKYCLGDDKLPLFVTVLHKENAANQHAKVKERSCPRADQQKVEYKAKCRDRLHYKEGAVLFELKRKHHDNKPYATQALSNYALR